MLRKICEGINHKWVEGKLLRTFIELIYKIIEKIINLIAKVIILLLRTIAIILTNIFKYIDMLISIAGKYMLAKTTKVDNNKIVFLTFQGDYTCNPKRIADEIIKQDLDYTLIWDIKSPILTSDYPLELKFVEHCTFDFYKEIASAKVIIENTNIVERLGIHKKSDQYLLQTWHGSLGIKRLDGDVVMGRRWKSIAKACQKNVDYCLSNSSFETEVFETSYWKGVPSILTGHARNDVFFASDEEKSKIRAKVCKSLGISVDTKIFLFAPTHRDNVDESYEALEYKKIKRALEKRFGGEWQIVIRLHNRLKKESKCWLKGLPAYVSDATYYEDMQELLVCTDVGVTDFSSWIFDYVLSRKPGFIVELGLETFKEQRGFYYPIETTPFPIAKDSDGLAENICNFDEEKYQKDISTFLEARGCMEDGHASERIVEKIKELMVK